MAFGGGNRRGVRSDINITPLVDVVLVLLIIFMVMSPSLLREMDISVPDTQTIEVAVPATEGQIVVSLDSKGAFALQYAGGKEDIRIELLGRRVSELMASREEKVVFFDIDDDASYGETVHAMDICRGAGARTLGIMTK